MIYYAAFVIALALITWGVPALIFWWLFDMPPLIALIVGFVTGSFLLSTLDIIPVSLLRKRGKSARIGKRP
jgi:fatty acid desaturase